MSVTVSIVGGPSVPIKWSTGMNAQTALEAAWTQLNSQPGGLQFTYALEYFGSLGYLVTMVNETYETLSPKEKPYYYWEFYYNNQPARAGIDGQQLDDGDLVAFAFEAYDPSVDAATTWKTAKHP